MKFGKALQDTSERFSTMPFVRYKLLKQILKSVLLEADCEESTKLKEDKNEIKTDLSEADFIKTLYTEVHTLNEYFIGKEEELVIRMQDLESAAEKLDNAVRINLLLKLVKFHGDITLLSHWEIINYTAFSKILKKHDKWIKGVSFRDTFLELLFRQPFYSKDLLERLSELSEKLINKLVSEKQLDTTQQNPELDNSELDNSELHDYDEFSALSKLQYAIRTWKDLGDNAHTPSTVLPWSKPLPDSMKVWFESQVGNPPNSSSSSSSSSSTEEEDNSNSPPSERVCNHMEEGVQETKRSRPDQIEVSSTEVSNEETDDRRANKIARFVE